MDWKQGYSAKYSCAVIDPVTWRETGFFDISSGDINHIDSGLRESASLKGVNYEHDPDKWIRIWMTAEQIQDSTRIALFTGITSAPEKNHEGALRDDKIQCYSVLRPAQENPLPRGWYAKKGFSAGETIKELLEIGPAPVMLEEGSPRLSQHIVAEKNETYLTMANKILTAIGWRLRISGHGEITICPQATKPSAEFSAQDYDIIEPKVSDTSDWFDVPNALRCIDSQGNQCEVRDEDPESRLSSVNRGRVIWNEEDDVILNDGESLPTYTARRLKELQATSREIKYSRSYHPDVMQSDLITLDYPAQDLSGTFYVVSQKITLDAAATTSEEVKTSWTPQ